MSRDTGHPEEQNNAKLIKEWYAVNMQFGPSNPLNVSEKMKAKVVLYRLRIGWRKDALEAA